MTPSANNVPEIYLFFFVALDDVVLEKRMRTDITILYRFVFGLAFSVWLRN